MFWLRVSQKVVVKMSAWAAALKRLAWGWTVSFQGGPIAWLLQEAFAPGHMGLSVELLESPHDMAAGFP